MITRVGNHRVRHGNVMDGIDDLMMGEVANFIYSDPPWGQGNLNYWQTINKRHTGAAPVEISYKEFLPHFFALCAKHSDGTLVIEYGERWRDDLLMTASAAGYKSGGVTTTYYKSGSKMRPCDVHILSRSGDVSLTDSFVASAKELNGLPLVKAAFDEYAPSSGVVLDPMCGMGYTAQAAIDNGLSFRGNELNAKRLGKTINRLKKSVS